MIDLRRRSRELVWAWADRMAAMLEPVANICGDNRTARVRRVGRSLVIEALAGLDLSAFWFGWLGAGDAARTINIREGRVQGIGFYLTLTAATVSIGGNAAAKHLIIATGNEQNGRIEVNTVAAENFTGHTTNEWRVPLYEVYLSESGNVVMSAIGSIGRIDVSSWNPL